MKIEDKGTYVIKQESARFPEAEKYIALHDVGAPIVKLLDRYSRGNDHFLVLEKATPLNLDTRKRSDFNRLVLFLEDFAAVNPAVFPGVDWAYLSEYWRATQKLVESAKELISPLYDPRLADCASPGAIFQAYERLVRNQPIFLTHGDPANLNLGSVNGSMVAFDLELTWLGDPFRDIALRTGASTMPYPENLSVQVLLDRYLHKRNLQLSDPGCAYRIVGAIYGGYFELGAFADVQANGEGSSHYGWAKVTISRYIHFALNLKLPT